MEIFCLGAQEAPNPPDKSAPELQASEPTPPSVTAKPSPAPAPLPLKPEVVPLVPAKPPEKQVAQPPPCPSADRGPELSGSPSHIGSFMHSMSRHGEAEGRTSPRHSSVCEEEAIPDPLSSPKIWPRASFSNGLIFLPTMMRSCRPRPGPLRQHEGRSDPLDPNRKLA